MTRSHIAQRSVCESPSDQCATRLALTQRVAQRSQSILIPILRTKSARQGRCADSREGLSRGSTFRLGKPLIPREPALTYRRSTGVGGAA